MRIFVVLFTLLCFSFQASHGRAAAISFLFQQVEPAPGDSVIVEQKVNIRGRVFDRQSKESMPFCNVFLANTLKGSTTDEDGFFSIDNIPLGRVQLIVSFIGYKTYRKTSLLETEEDLELEIFLQPVESQLAEVQVKSKKDKTWERQVKRFEKVFLGQSLNARHCKILNPYVLEFEGDKWSFTASAELPLEVENRALGYKLKYYLHDFSLEAKGLSRFFGDVQYEHLLAEDEKEAAKWIENRKEAYQGSLRHFFKALVDNNLEEEFFLAYEINVNSYEDASYRLQGRVGHSRVPLQAQNVVHPVPSIGDKKLILKKAVEILYKGDYDFFSPYKDAPYPVTIINPKFIATTIHESGWLYKPLDVEVYGALAKEGVADMLPFEYLPENESQQDIYAILKDDKTMTELVEEYNAFSYQSPNDKVFLHFDKPFYAAGDIIWFNSFLTYYNSNKLIPGLSKLHVDFISPEKEILKSLILPVTDGLAPGDFSIADSLPSGKYTIRAYSSEMAAFGEDYLFQKSLEIINPRTGAPRKNQSSSLYAEEIDVQFFPEGGNIIAQVPGIVAFKAIGSNGKGLPVKGYVLNNKNERVAEFESNHVGVGSFLLNPKKDILYTAKVEGKEGLMDFPLPEVLSEGHAFTVDNSHPETLKVKIQHSDKKHKSDFYLIGQSKEIICYKSRGKFQKDLPEIEISKTALPEGVFQLTLFDEQGIPQCERLVYVSHGNNGVEVAMQAGKQHYAKREKVDLKISVTENAGVPLEGLASLSVLDASLFKAEDISENIATYLLLSSDLKGTIENPEYYFKDRSAKVRHDLDLIMLTHGWRRFSWEEISRPDFKIPQNPDSTSKLAIQGTVRINKRAIRRAQVLFMTHNSGYTLVHADDEGRFRIPDVQLFDTTTVIVTPMDFRGKNINATIDFDAYSPPAMTQIPSSSNRLDSNGSANQQFLRKSSLKNKIDSIYNFEGTTMLDEVQVQARKIKEEKRDLSKLHGTPDLVFDDISERFAGHNNMAQFVDSRLKFLNISRGPSSLPGQSHGGNKKMTIPLEGSSARPDDPLFLLDGRPVDKGEIAQIIPSEVDRVEILKAGATAAIYGVRSGNGVVAIYTKTTIKEVNRPSGIKAYNLPAYSAAREFYQPKYETDPEEDEFHRPDIRTTLFWNPKVVTDPNGQASISFYNSDDTSRFLVTLQGISLNGEPFTKTFSFGEERRKP